MDAIVARDSVGHSLTVAAGKFFSTWEYAPMSGDIRDTENTRALAYFITFSCYGARLHGDENGSVDNIHNLPGTPFIPPSEARQAAKKQQMNDMPYVMDHPRREVVLTTIREVCAYRKWRLLAAHVRSTHVHIVIEANADPEKIMNDLKAYSSRRLTEAGNDEHGRQRWARHGSTRYLWTNEAVEDTVHYTLHQQGDVMSAYPMPDTSTESHSISEPRP